MDSSHERDSPLPNPKKLGNSKFVEFENFQHNLKDQGAKKISSTQQKITKYFADIGRKSSEVVPPQLRIGIKDKEESKVDSQISESDSNKSTPIKKRKRETPLTLEFHLKRFLDDGMGETEFKTNALVYCFELAMQNSNISKWRRQVIEKVLQIPDDGICGKCRHPSEQRLSKCT